MFEQFNTSLQNLWAKLAGWLDLVILSLPNLVLALIVLSVSLLMVRLLKKGFRKTLSKATSNVAVVSILTNVLVTVFMLIVLFVVLGILDLDNAVKALLGTAGVAGLAVGLALQDPLINIFSGMLMSMPDTYSIDDWVETNGYFGKIKKITLRNTIVLTPTGQEVVIPNKDIIQKPLMNYTRSGRRRVDINCGIAYNADLDKVKNVAIASIENCGFDSEEIQPVELFFHTFGDSSINFTLRFWQNASSQRDFNAAKDKALVAMKKAFDANGIVIPFPIRTLDFGVAGGVRLDEMDLTFAKK